MSDDNNGWHEDCYVPEGPSEWEKGAVDDLRYGYFSAAKQLLRHIYEFGYYTWEALPFTEEEFKREYCRAMRADLWRRNVSCVRAGVTKLQELVDVDHERAVKFIRSCELKLLVARYATSEELWQLIYHAVVVDGLFKVEEFIGEAELRRRAQAAGDTRFTTSPDENRPG